MRSLKSIVDFGSGMFPAQHRTRRGVRRMACLEILEPRNLLSAMSSFPAPGLSVTNGELSIVGNLHSGNVASVSINPATLGVQATLNGVTTQFSPGQVAWIAYVSGSNGGDTFTNNTSLTSVDYGLGGGNDFRAGSGLDEVILYGNGNVVDNHGGFEIVLTNGGQDTIAPDSGGQMIIT